MSPLHEKNRSTLQENITFVHSMRKKSDDERRVDQKVIAAIVMFMGSTLSVYAHILFYCAFFYFDRDFSHMSDVACIEAIALALFVLINQTRMDFEERRYDDLHLQTSLLIEKELTRLSRIHILMAKKIGIDPRDIEKLESIGDEIKPEHLLEEIASVERETPPKSIA